MFIPRIYVYTTKTHLSCTDMLSESDFISFKCEAKINPSFFNCKVCCILQSTNIEKFECIAEPTFQSHPHTELKRPQVQCQQVKDTLVYLSHKEHSLVSRTLLDQICQRMLIARFHHLGVITEWQVDEFRGVTNLTRTPPMKGEIILLQSWMKINKLYVIDQQHVGRCRDKYMKCPSCR